MFIAIVGLKADAQGNDWIIDSGASQHMTFKNSEFKTPQSVAPKFYFPSMSYIPNLLQPSIL